MLGFNRTLIFNCSSKSTRYIFPLATASAQSATMRVGREREEFYGPTAKITQSNRRMEFQCPELETRHDGLVNAGLAFLLLTIECGT